MNELIVTGARKYDHLQRQGHRHTRGIEEGEVLVFPKLDGTNARVWSDGTTVFAGSRSRTLTLTEDNAGFYAWLMSDDATAVSMRALALDNTDFIFYGEWLIRNCIRTYEDGAWRRFWIFDVFNTGQTIQEDRGYIHYDKYTGLLIPAGLDFVPPLARLGNPALSDVQALTESNTFLIKEGEGVGEGVVVKNYSWRRGGVQGDRVWGKFVRSEFKASNGGKARAPKGAPEPVIVEHFVTETLVRKTLAKVVLDIQNTCGDPLPTECIDEFICYNYRGKVIPQLLGRVWHDLIDEEMFAILKRHKGATINFGTLQSLVSQRIKKLTPELF